MNCFCLGWWIGDSGGLRFGLQGRVVWSLALLEWDGADVLKATCRGSRLHAVVYGTLRIDVCVATGVVLLVDHDYGLDVRIVRGGGHIDGLLW